MMLKIKALAILAVTTVLFLGFGPGVSALDCSSPNLSTVQALQCGANNGSSSAPQDSAKAAGNLNSSLANIINVLSIVVAIIAVIMIIVGGFRYVTSGGNQEAVSGAKRTIIYALVGLVIVALAQTLVKFVINRVS